MRRDGRILPVREGLGPLSCPVLPGAAAMAWAGQRLLVAGEKLWELELEAGQREVLAELRQPRAIAVSPDADRVVVAEEGLLSVLRLRDGGREAELEVEEQISEVGWFFAGTRASVWARIPGGALVADHTLDPHRRIPLPDGVGMGMDRRGKLVLASATEGGVVVAGAGRPLPEGRWPVRVTEGGLVAELLPDGVRLHRSQGPPMVLEAERPTTFAMAPSGTLLALGLADGQVLLGNVLAPQLRALEALSGEQGPIRALAFSGRGGQLAALGTKLQAWGW